jgi:hypothetical protein
VLVLLPVSPILRGASVVLLLTGFLAPAARPAWGRLQVDVFDVGASRAVLFSTTHHQLLAGTGEGFGTAGRRFETRILPALLRAGGSGLDLWMLQKPDRDALRAVTLGHGRLAIQETVVIESQRAPPELQPCRPRDWLWDGVHFSIVSGASGCWLRAGVGAHGVLLAPERADVLPEPSIAADVWILPRRAEQARRLLDGAPPPLLLAGLAASEWQAAPWRELREQSQQRGGRLVSSAQGAIRVQLAPASAPVLTQGGGWRPGIWSASRADAQCRR